MLNRREFLQGVGAAALAGNVCRAEDLRIYGKTIRDRLWMWGHHADCCLTKSLHGLPVGRRIDQAAACTWMGIPNCCIIRWCGLPKPPFDDYMRQFAPMRRLAWSITDGAPGTFDDKVKMAFEMAEKHPKISTFFLDDYFSAPSFRQGSDRIRATAEAIHAKGRELAVVLYSQDRLKPEYREELSLCDTISFWVWKGKDLATQEADLQRAREFVGPGKKILLGLYMWDFGQACAIQPDAMRRQLDLAYRLLKNGTLTGLIFHSTFICDLGLEAVDISRRWIADHGEENV